LLSNTLDFFYYFSIHKVQLFESDFVALHNHRGAVLAGRAVLAVLAGLAVLSMQLS
jgi:hypothetical protein